ncbi:unnamed protein product [Oncorhynchus mykiss]|uniref:Golgin subfamily A member 7/ERF4 domain-containing protein n=1 Tax=Oncorhynchus mykiss TaxID=8022 RepID=A0A060Z8N1_ONCMY|nr:unnamed protein product [Oncorhynchus mykiss]
MQTSSLRRQVKNMVNQYSEAEIKVCCCACCCCYLTFVLLPKVEVRQIHLNSVFHIS